MDQPIDLGAALPALYESMIGLEKQVSAALAEAGVAKGFTHLLRLRASQINGCAYCIRMHAHDASTSGETPARIALVAAWRETAYFTPQERAAFALVEGITQVSDGQLAETMEAEVQGVLNAEAIAAISWLGVVINTWNRIAITGRKAVEP